jgi:hypothetical protein
MIATIPSDRRGVLRLMIFPLIPVAPLALTLVPIDRLVAQLMNHCSDRGTIGVDQRPAERDGTK